MKKSIIIALTALAFVAWGCSSDHEDTESSGKFQSGTPTWTPPNYDDYEQTMTIEIQLQDKLQSSASEHDLLCAMINNEVRGLTEPKWVDGKWVFILTVVAISILLGVILKAKDRKAYPKLYEEGKEIVESV